MKIDKPKEYFEKLIKKEEEFDNESNFDWKDLPESKQLLPCPRCKSTNVSVSGDDFDGDVGCEDCKLETYVCYGIKNAVNVWNNRINMDRWRQPSIFEVKYDICEDDIKNACRVIENLCRSLGKDTTIIFTDKLVSIAPPSWSGDSTGETLYEALTESLKHKN